MIHTTIGVYASGDYKVNGVPSENLAEHIKYNITYRPGRAFILDGVVLHTGIGVDIGLLDRMVAKSKSLKQEKDTQPYI